MTIANLLHILVLLVLCGFLIRLIYHLWPLIYYAHQPLPFVPISRKLSHTIAQLPELQSKQTIVDLGCGRGHLLSAMRKYHPTAELFGVEYNHQLFASSYRRLHNQQPITLIEGDMFTYDISQMDVIVGWWIGGDFIKKLLLKFLTECKPGCVIVSYMFPLPTHPQLVERVVRVGKERVYVYCITPGSCRGVSTQSPCKTRYTNPSTTPVVDNSSVCPQPHIVLYYTVYELYKTSLWLNRT